MILPASLSALDRNKTPFIQTQPRLALKYLRQKKICRRLKLVILNVLLICIELFEIIISIKLGFDVIFFTLFEFFYKFLKCQNFHHFVYLDNLKTQPIFYETL